MGGYAALSVNYEKFGRETARLVDRVIKSGSADNIPPVDYLGKDLVVNTGTATLIGKPIPTDIVASAYRVFE